MAAPDVTSLDRRQVVAEDDVLEVLNQTLERPEIEAYRECPERPTIHVLGLPRSGTTLALQLLVANTDVAYVDHVAAAFWRAPVTGLRLSERLRREIPRPASYRSSFGRTADLVEPHEFSYFWARLFGTPYGLDSLAEPEGPETVDWAFVREVVTNMTAAVSRPLVLKSFHTIWRLPELCRTLPKTIIVLVRRDPLDVALSLVRMREQLYGTRETWASIKPRQYTALKDESWAVQIAGQIRYVGEAIAGGLSHVPAGSLVEVAYDDLCRDPAAFVHRVVAAVTAQGDGLEVLADPVPVLPSPRSGDPDTERRLRQALTAMGIDLPVRS